MAAANNSKYKMSAEKLDSIKAELLELETTGMKRVAEQIKEARSFGDLSENSEYDEAKREQEKLYSKIDELKDLVENAIIVDTDESVPEDVVTLGSRVTIVEEGEEDEEEYEIVGSQDANPVEGRISDDSPLGKALHAHRAGDIINVEAPSGVITFSILKVENN